MGFRALLCAGLLFALSLAALAQSISAPDEDLVRRLLAAPDPEARRTMLAAHRSRITPVLIQAILDRAWKDRGDLPRALQMVVTALEAATFIGDEREAAACHLQRGRIQSYTGDPRSGLADYDRALSIYKRLGDRRGEARCYLQQGFVASHGGEYEQAAALFERAIPMFRAVGDRSGEAGCYVRQGLVAYWKGDSVSALALFKKAVPLYRAAADGPGEADCYLNQGDVAHTSGNTADALALYDKAAALYGASDEKLGEARCLLRQGIVRAQLGDVSAAQKKYAEAAAAFRAMGYRQGEASCCLYQGKLAFDGADYGGAQALYARAVALHREVGDKGGEANCYLSQGLAAYATGDLDRATALYDRAIPLFSAIGDKLGQANAWKNKADVLYYRGNCTDAFKLYCDAMPLFEAVGNKLGEANCYVGGAMVAFTRGYYPAAQEMYQRARALYRSIDYTAGEATCIKGQGDVAYHTGNHATALSLFTTAAAIFQACGSSWNEAFSVYRQSLCLERLGRLSEGRTTVERALALAERVREQAGSHGARSGVLDEFAKLYHAAARMSLSRGHREEAFALAEKGHGRNLFDLVSGGGLQIYKRMTPAERSQSASLESTLSRTNARLSDLLSAASREPDKVESAARARDAARNALDQFEKDLYVRHPELAAARGANTLSLSAVAAFLPGDAWLLEYSVDEDDTLLFAVSRRGLEAAVRLPIKGQALTAEVAEFRTACARPPAALSQARMKRRADMSARLYRMLVHPALTGGRPLPRQLIIVPDGPLFEMPFQALQDNGRFLGEQYLITYSAGASLLKSALDEGTRPGRPRAAGELLVFANPDFGAAEVAAVRSERGKLSPLPGTQREADALKELFPRATLHTGREAQKSLARAEMPRFRYVHFATHGILDDTSPLYSALALSKPSDASDDGMLYAREIAQMDLAADLVVLSACNTGRGDVRAGDGVLGLLWACTVAGAPTTVVSQWQVDDEATAALMRGFYSGLKAGKPRGQALRDAQVKLIRDGRHADPFYWAAFILCGDWR